MRVRIYSTDRVLRRLDAKVADLLTSSPVDLTICNEVTGKVTKTHFSSLPTYLSSSRRILCLSRRHRYQIEVVECK